jgi:hypothetical protein
MTIASMAVADSSGCRIFAGRFVTAHSFVGGECEIAIIAAGKSLRSLNRPIVPLFRSLFLSQLWLLVESRAGTSRALGHLISIEASEENIVRKIAFIVAAATLVLTLPASAQGLSVGVGESGVRVGVDRPHYRERHYDRRYDSRARYRHGDTVVIRKQRHWDRDYDRRGPRKTVIIER